LSQEGITIKIIPHKSIYEGNKQMDG